MSPVPARLLPRPTTSPRLYALLVSAFPLLAVAHDSPDQIIAAITAQIGRDGTTAELLYRRATEHRALGHTPEAMADFQASLRLQPSASAYADLAELYQSQGDLTTALSLLDRALTDAPSPPLHVARARLLHLAGQHRKALAEFAYVPAPDVDAVLLHAQIHRTLDDHTSRIDVLKSGHTSSRSAVLYAAWIDALLDTGQATAALPEIGATLKNRRFKAAWQIRRARALLQLDHNTQARTDLHAAIAETTARLESQKTAPDLTLLIDRSQAHALLGDRTAAQRDITTARALGASPRLLRPAIDSLRNSSR
ncbi:MAG: hypothetical protein P8J87_00270 [Verrucomicrobiales bacterium]|nr:hypothetical protein [Verrucomicrobiales bacterium]